MRPARADIVRQILVVRVHQVEISELDLVELGDEIAVEISGLVPFDQPADRSRWRDAKSCPLRADLARDSCGHLDAKAGPVLDRSAAMGDAATPKTQKALHGRNLRAIFVSSFVCEKAHSRLIAHVVSAELSDACISLSMRAS